MKIIETKNNFKAAFIFSITLHIIFFIFLINASYQKKIIRNVTRNNIAIDAVMLDPNVVPKEYNPKQKYKNSIKRADKLHHTKTFSEQKIEASKVINARGVKASKFYIEKAASKDTFKTKKMGLKSKNTMEKNVKSKAIKKTEFKDKLSEIDALFDNLSNIKNAPDDRDAHKEERQASGKNEINITEASDSDIRNYIGQIQSAIQNQFYNSTMFTGKTCKLCISLSADGLVTRVKEVSGDPALCQAAVSATKLVRMLPKPPSDKVYQYFKNFKLEFKPK